MTSSPESLRRIAHYLNKLGFITNIEQGAVSYQLHHRGVLSTTSGWLLTWSRSISGHLVTSGRVWVVDGAVNAIPFISPPTP